MVEEIRLAIEGIRLSMLAIAISLAVSIIPLCLDVISNQKVRTIARLFAILVIINLALITIYFALKII